MNEELYEITYNSDRTEGKGAQISTGFVAPKRIALEIVGSKTYAAKFGTMGCPGGQWDIKHYKAKVVNSVAEFEQALKTDAREKALSKLTVEDRMALGLS